MCDILVVDDSQLVRATLVSALEAEGWNVREADCPVDAMRIMSDPDLTCSVLVTDIDLGAGTDGFSIATKVRKLAPKHPIVYVTGRPWVFDDRCFDEAERTLSKPFKAESLILAILAVAPNLGGAA